MTSPAKGRYVVQYNVSVFAYVDMEGGEWKGVAEPRVTRVVVDDENTGPPTQIESDNGDVTRQIALDSEEGKAVIVAVDGPDAEWPSWDHGW